MSDWIPIDEATLVCEMANKHKSETLLPMNIWIDENQTYIKGGEPASFEESQKLNLKVDELIKYNN